MLGSSKRTQIVIKSDQRNITKQLLYPSTVPERVCAERFVRERVQIKAEEIPQTWLTRSCCLLVQSRGSAHRQSRAGVSQSLFQMLTYVCVCQSVCVETASIVEDRPISFHRVGLRVFWEH